VNRVRVKVCGLTRLEDALLAASLGADALGFVFWASSPRAIAPEAAAAIVRQLPPLVGKVGVFVDAPPSEVAAIANSVGLTALQLHGDERPEQYSQLWLPIMKAVALDDDAARRTAAAWPARFTVLVDATDRDKRGGTGRRADWGQAAALAATRPVVLAGGLSPDNVGEAIRTVRPWAVDVSSGVESSPGIKDPDKLRRFVAAVAAESGADA
jgi:phosphoribosylanthranilate isomerase